MLTILSILPGLLKEYYPLIFIIIFYAFIFVWGRVAENEQYLMMILKLFPKNAQAHFDLGYFLSQKNTDLDKAEKELRQAIAIKPQFYSAYYELLSVLEKKTNGELDLEKQCQKMFLLFPKDPFAYIHMGHIYRSRDLSVEAEQCYKKAIALAPRLSNAYDNYARFLVSQEKFLEAEPVCRKAIELEPGKASSYLPFAYVLLKLEKYPAAEKQYLRLIARTPKDPAPYIMLGELFRIQNRYDDAEKILKKAISVCPQDENMLEGLAEFYERSGRIDEAEQAYRKAIDLNPGESSNYFQLGMLLHLQHQRYAEAEVLFLKGLELNPQDETALYNLACIKSILQDSESAFHYLQMAIEKNFDRTWAWDDKDLEWLRKESRFAEIVGVRPEKK